MTDMFQRYLFNVMIALIIIYNCHTMSILNSWNNIQGQLIGKSDKNGVSSIYKKIIVKRSTVNNGLELNKTFSNVNQRNGNFSCVLTFRVLSPNPVYVNSTFVIIDDIKGLTVQNVFYNIFTPANSNPTLFNQSSENIIVSIIYTGVEQFYAQYYFQTGVVSSQLTKSVTVSNMSQNPIISDSACIIPASFSDNLNSNTGNIAFILLGLLISFILLIFILFCCGRCNRSQVIYDEGIDKNQKFENRFLLVDNSQANVQKYSSPNDEGSFINVLIQEEPRVTEHEIYQLDVTNAVRTDNKLNGDFKELNKTIFQIWLNNVVSKYPNVKPKTDIVRTRVNSKEEEISTKFRNSRDEITKQIMAETINRNKMNLEYLTMQQKKEKERLLEHTDSANKKYVENIMERVFQQQRHDLIIQLKVKEDLAMEKNRLLTDQALTTEINDLYLSGVMEVISSSVVDSSGEQTKLISQEDSDHILKNYFDWQQKLQLMKENEKIRQMAKLEYIFQNRTNLTNQREIESKDNKEIIEKKIEYFQDYILNLKEEEEIDQATASGILSDFEKYKADLLKEKEKFMENQIKNLLNRLNESRKNQINEKKQQYDNELNHLMVSHGTGEDFNALAENLVKIEIKNYEDMTAEEFNHDTVGTQELLKLQNDIATETMENLDEKISELVNELSNEGFSARDIKEILDTFHKKINKLTSIQNAEKKKQIKNMKDRLEKSKERIGKNIDKQMKEQRHQYESENNIVDELLNIHKTLSDSDRYQILKEYNKHKLFVENSITNSYLEQRKKMEEALASKKKKKLDEMDVKHNEKLEALFDKKTRNKNRKSEQEIKDECQKDLMVDYVNNTLNVFAFTAWKDDLDKEKEAIRNELLLERAALLNKKEEESVSLMMQIQMLKAKESVELREHEEKLLNFQLATIEANGKDSSCKDIYKTYQKNKDNVQEEAVRNKLNQEIAFKKKLLGNKQGSLLSDLNSDPLSDTVAKQTEQNLEDQMLKNEIKLERSMQNVEKDFLKKFIAAVNYRREDIFNLMLEIYPVKTNKEIKELVEEMCPITKQPNQPSPQNPKISLIEAYKKYTERNAARLGGTISTMNRATPTNFKGNNSLTFVDNGAPRNFENKNNDYEHKQRYDENDEVKSRKTNKKVRRKKPDENDDLSEEF